MRILEVCTSQSLGGLELYFISCCKNLAQPAELLAYVSEQSPIHQQVIKNGMPFGLEKSGIGLIRRIFSLKKTIETFKPDIIHSHVKTDLLIIAICRYLVKKDFKHVHTRQMNLPGKKKDLFHRFIYSRIDLLLAITHRLKMQILQNTSLSADKVRVLYYGVPEKKAGDIESIDGLKNDHRFKIGLISRIDAKKHQHVMLEAVSHLKEKKLNVSTYLIGKSTDENYRKKLEVLIQKSRLEDQIKFVGFVSDPISLMPHFDVILLTSSDETFGLVLAEAMRAGVAVIGADGGGVPEIIDHGKTGLLFEPGNAKSLALGIEKLMEDRKLLKSLAKNGKEKADQIFNETTHFEDLKKICSDLLTDS